MLKWGAKLFDQMKNECVSSFPCQYKPWCNGWDWKFDTLKVNLLENISSILSQKK